MQLNQSLYNIEKDKDTILDMCSTIAIDNNTDFIRHYIDLKTTAEQNNYVANFIMQNTEIEPTRFQIGLHKVFFKSQSDFNKLLSVMNQTYEPAVIKIQRWWRSILVKLNAKSISVSEALLAQEIGALKSTDLEDETSDEDPDSGTESDNEHEIESDEILEIKLKDFQKMDENILKTSSIEEEEDGDDEAGAEIEEIDAEDPAEDQIDSNQLLSANEDPTHSNFSSSGIERDKTEELFTANDSSSESEPSQDDATQENTTAESTEDVNLGADVDINMFDIDPNEEGLAEDISPPAACTTPYQPSPNTPTLEQIIKKESPNNSLLSVIQKELPSIKIKENVSNSEFIQESLPRLSDYIKVEPEPMPDDRKVVISTPKIPERLPQEPKQQKNSGDYSNVLPEKYRNNQKINYTESHKHRRMKEGLKNMQQATQEHRHSKLLQEGMIKFQENEEITKLRHEVMLKHGRPSIQRSTATNATPSSQQPAISKIATVQPTTTAVKQEATKTVETYFNQATQGIQPEILKSPNAVRKRLDVIPEQNHRIELTNFKSSIPDIPLGMIDNSTPKLAKNRKISTFKTGNQTVKIKSVKVNPALEQANQQLSQPNLQYYSTYQQQKQQQKHQNSSRPRKSSSKSRSIERNNKLHHSSNNTVKVKYHQTSNKSNEKNNKSIKNANNFHQKTQNTPTSNKNSLALEKSAYYNKIMIFSDTELQDFTISLESKRIDFMHENTKEQNKSMQFMISVISKFIEELLSQKLMISKTGYQLTLSHLLTFLRNSIENLKEDPKILKKYSQDDFETLGQLTEKAMIAIFDEIQNKNSSAVQQKQLKQLSNSLELPSETNSVHSPQ